LKMNPTNHVVQLTAGRLYKKAEFWGKARTCFESSLNSQKTPEAYYELATLYEKEGNLKDANRYYQSGLKLAAYGTGRALLANVDDLKHLPYSYID
jgi:HemY protein